MKFGHDLGASNLARWTCADLRRSCRRTGESGNRILDVLQYRESVWRSRCLVMSHNNKQLFRGVIMGAGRVIPVNGNKRRVLRTKLVHIRRLSRPHPLLAHLESNQVQKDQSKTLHLSFTACWIHESITNKNPGVVGLVEASQHASAARSSKPVATCNCSYLHLLVLYWLHFQLLHIQVPSKMVAAVQLCSVSCIGYRGCLWRTAHILYFVVFS